VLRCSGPLEAAIITILSQLIPPSPYLFPLSQHKHSRERKREREKSEEQHPRGGPDHHGAPATRSTRAVVEPPTRNRRPDSKLRAPIPQLQNRRIRSFSIEQIASATLLLKEAEHENPLTLIIITLPSSTIVAM
jgi:hypothetical protein